MRDRSNSHVVRSAKGILVIPAVFCVAVLAISSGSAIPASGRNPQLALAVDHFNVDFDNLRLSVTVREGAAKEYDLQEGPLLSALAERARAIAQELHSNLVITAEDSTAFVGPDPPGTPPWPKEIHAHFDVERDPTDAAVIIVSITMRRGIETRPTSWFATVGAPFKIVARCEEPGCLYRKIVDGVSGALRVLGKSPRSMNGTE